MRGRGSGIGIGSGSTIVRSVVVYPVVVVQVNLRSGSSRLLNMVDGKMVDGSVGGG